MEDLLKVNLPEAMDRLGNRYDNFEQVAHYLETNYISAQRSGADKLNVENEAKSYVVKGLINVLNDIENIATNVTTLVELQNIATNSLSVQVELAQHRLKSMRNQHLLHGLDQMQSLQKMKSDVSIVDYPLSTATPYRNGTSSLSVAASSSAFPKKLSLTEKMNLIGKIGVVISPETNQKEGGIKEELGSNERELSNTIIDLDEQVSGLKIADDESLTVVSDA